MRRTVSAAIAMVLALSLAPSSVLGKTFEVTRKDDPTPGKCKRGDCSLREAIRAANGRSGADVVTLPDRGRYDLERPNSLPGIDEEEALRGDLDVTERLALRHPGKGKATIDANGVDRVLEVIAPTSITRIKLTGGSNPSHAAPRGGSPLRTGLQGFGAGIESNAALTLRRSVVAGNRNAAHGGGIEVFLEAGGAASAPLRLIRSRVARNHTVGLGGGIDAYESLVSVKRSRVVGNQSGNAGGGVTLGTNAELRMSKSTVAGNVAGAGVGGVYLFEASGRITQSTVSGNSTGPDGSSGGIEMSSFTPPHTLAITNSTIADNLAAEGGGGISASGPQAEIQLRNVTVARNDGDSDDDGGDGGGGLLQSNNATFSAVNSLIGLNRAGSSPEDCAGAFASGGGNLLTTIPLACEGFDPDVGGDFLRSAPKVGRLRRNGGPTQTIALKKGSPAIGRAIKSEAPNRDQRGTRRDNKPDIGAYER